MPKSIPVVSITSNGERTHYPSIKEAAKAINASPSQIHGAIHFGRIVHGMKWEKDGE